MKQCLQFLCTTALFFVLMTAGGQAWGQILLSEDFNFSGNLTDNGWTAHNGGGTQPINTIDGLSFPGYIGSGIGNAANVDNNGEDVNKTFTSQPGDVYISFLLQTQSPNSADYFFNTIQSGTSFYTRIYINSNGTGIGITDASSYTGPYVTITPGQPYLIVIKRASDGQTSLFVFDELPTSEPSVADISYAGANVNLTAVALRQYNASQRQIVDGIRVATSWNDIFPPTCTEATITLTSSPGTDGQTVTENTAITDITYEVTDADGVSLTGALPDGVTGSYDSGTGVFTISGTPTESGTFNYTLTPTGDDLCDPIPTASGSITVTSASCIAPENPNGSIVLSAGSDNPACSVTQIHYIHGSGQPEAGMEYYWQSTTGGSDLTYPVTSDHIVTVSGTYYVRAYNTADGGCWSDGEVASAEIVINEPATITIHPSNQSAAPSTSATFTTDGSGTVSWEESTDGGTSWTAVADGGVYSGATTNSLTITNPPLTMNDYQYRSVFTPEAPCEVVYSDAAVLVVVDAPVSILEWNTVGNSGNETTEPSIYNNPNVGTSNLTQGSGITPAANGNRFGGSSWSSTLNDAVSTNDYIEFIVTPEEGYTFTPTSFEFIWDRSTTGPSDVTLRSSADNFTTDLGSITGLPGSTSTRNTIMISGLDNLTTTIFRLYGYNATNVNTGTGGFDCATSNTNPNVKLFGSINPLEVGEPTLLEFSSIPVEAEVGVPFDLTVCVKDDDGNVITDYPDPITLTQTSGTPAIVTPTSPAIPTDGCVTFTITPQAGDETISFEATSGTLISAVTGDIEVVTPCTVPEDVTDENAVPDNQSVAVTWTLLGCYDEILVVANETAGISFVPTGDGSIYVPNPVYAGPDQVVYKGGGTTVNVTGLTNGVTYYFEIFTRKGTAWSSGVEVSAMPDFAISVPNIATLRAMWDGNTTKVYRLTGEAVMTFKASTRNQKYIQDATDAILIDDPNPAKITTNYNIGDGITNITGTLFVFGSNLLQFVPVEDPGAPTSSGNVVVPEVITVSQLNTGNYDAHLVKVENITFSVGGNFTVSTNYTINDGSNDGVLRTQYPNNPIVDYIGTSIPSTPKSIIGVVFNNTGGTVNQLVPRNMADFLCASSEISEEMAIAGPGEVLVSWTNPIECFDKILVVAREGNPNDGNPTGDGSSYIADAIFGDGSPFGNGYVVYQGTGTSVNVTNLINETPYYFKIYTYLNETGQWSNGVELNATPTTFCSPVEVISPIASKGNTVVDVSWIHPGFCANTILVVASEGTANTGTPTGDGSAYLDDNQFGNGSSLGNGFVVFKGIGTSVNVESLTNGVQYFFKIFTYNEGNGIWSDGVEVNAIPNYPAVTIWNNPIDAMDSHTQNPYTTGDVVVDHLTVTGIGRGSGITGTSANGRYTANNWNLSDFDSNDYFYFGLTPEIGYKLSIDALNLTYQSSGSGPVSFEVRSSLDNYASGILIGTLTNSGTPQSLEIDLSGVSFQNLEDGIEFRFYTWGGSNTSGSLSVNDFAFTGSVNAGAAMVFVFPENLSDFEYRGYGPSDSQTFSVNGEGLSSEVYVTASSDYEVSLDGITYATNQTIIPTGGNISNQEVYVRLAVGLMPGLHNGNVTLTYSGGDNKVVTLGGKVLVPFTLPYSNPFTTTADYNSAVDTSFIFDGITHLTSNGGYLRFDNPGSSVISPPMDFSIYGTLHLQFTHLTGGSSSSLSVLVSNDNGATYIPVFDFNSNPATATEDVFINLQDYTMSSQGRIKFVSLSGNDIRLRGLSMIAFTENAIFNQGEVFIDRLTIGHGAMIELQGTILTINQHINRPGTEGYIITPDENAYLFFPVVGSEDVIFHVGTASTYLPLTISVSGGTEYFYVNVKGNIDEVMCSGADPNKSVPATWEIFSEADPAATSLTFDFTDAVLPLDFDAASAKIIHCVDPLEEFGTIVGTIATTTGGFSSFSPFSITSDPAVLPVSWLFVKASPVEKNSIDVSWGTASEINNSYYEIERSIDGIHFSKIGRVNAIGNTTTPNVYSYRDLNPVDGINYFRIKQVDYSSAYSISKIVSATIHLDKMSIVHSINKVRFEGEVEGARATLFTLSGQPIFTMIVHKNSILDLSSFVAGAYVVKLSKEGNSIIEKIVVQ